jgi:hypothetical protein
MKMVNGIVGTIVFLVAAAILWFLVRKIADLLIGIVTLLSIVIIFVIGGEASIGITLLLAIALAVLATILIIPIVPLSSYGSHQLGVPSEEEKLRSEIDQLKNRLNQNKLMISALRRLERIEKDLGIAPLPEED